MEDIQEEGEASVDGKMQSAMDWLRDPSLDDTGKVVEGSVV